MSDHTMKKLAKPALLLATIIWGSSFVVMKGTLDTFPVFTLLAVRFTVAAALLAVVFWKRWRQMNRSHLLRGVIMGTLLFTAYVTQTYGLTGTTPGKNAFLTAGYCVIVPFLYWVSFKHRPDKYNIAAALVCIAGIGCVSLTGDFSISWGDALTLVGSFFYAAHILAVARSAKGHDIFLLTILQFATAAVLATIGTLLVDPPIAAPSADALLGLGYLAVFCTAGALLLQNIGQKYTEPAQASVLLTLESVFGIICSIIFYHERPTGLNYLGFALIFCAVIISETKLSFLKKRKNIAS